jgi:hypothetical protein
MMDAHNIIDDIFSVAGVTVDNVQKQKAVIELEIRMEELRRKWLQYRFSHIAREIEAISEKLDVASGLMKVLEEIAKGNQGY